MDILLLIVGIMMSIIIHEVAHGYMADKLGDPTAKLSGRLTLNPIPHIDIIGTIIVPFLFYFSPWHFIFGWAKPVPVEPYNLRNPKKDMLLISLVGPAVNLILAVILSIFFRILIVMYPTEASFIFLSTFFIGLIGTNVLLAVFNLIPISPLDGEKILVGLLPDNEAQKFDAFMSKFGTILLFLLIFPIFGGSSLISSISNPILNFILRILIP